MPEHLQYSMLILLILFNKWMDTGLAYTQYNIIFSISNGRAIISS